MNAKDYAAEWKWMSSTEAKQRSAAAKSHALSEFKKRFSRADMSKFIAQVEFDANRKATARVLFPDGDGSWEDALIEDSKYWSQPLKDALGMQQDGGFPYQLSLLQQNKPQPVPAIAFSDNITQSVADIFNKEMNIYVTPTAYFTTKFRQIFTKTQIKFTTAKYARKWLAKPDMSFWPQQLNFALWCATTGCGVSREMLFSNSSLNLSEQIRAFYQFHVYYTTRKILYEMGGIQSKNALPDDPAFNRQDNPYDVASYKRICAEFGIDPSTNFRFTYGQNHGLGYVNIMYSDGPFAHKQWQYPPADLSNPSSRRLSGDSGATDNNTIAFIRNDQGADKQFEHFVPNQTSGLTLNGLGRINRSIEAFGYCILGAQANTLSSILDNTQPGTAKNTQNDFLVLVNDSIKTLNVSNEPVKYQHAIQATKVRLNFAVAHGVLLLPSRMIINTESIVGYNNNLRMATDDMKLGVNNHVNQGTKKAGLKLMAGGPSKVNPPNSHPSNPIHKQATEAQGIAKPQPSATPPAKPPAPTPPTQPATTEPVDSHHVNKTLVAVGGLAVVGLIVYASS